MNAVEIIEIMKADRPFYQKQKLNWRKAPPPQKDETGGDRYKSPRNENKQKERS